MTIIYAPTPENPLTTTKRIRNTRLYLLQSCDWAVGVDSPLSDSKKAEWATYRQALRDLPSSYTDSDNFSDVVFPTEPA
jgi:hypothetical protein